MTYSYPALRVAFAISCGVVALAAGAMWMGLVEETALETPGLVALVALVAAGVWRGATVRVDVDDSGFVVRNVLRTRRVAWREVEDVEEGEPWFWHRFANADHRCPCLVLRGRRRSVKLLAMLDLGDHRYARVVKEWQRR